MKKKNDTSWGKAAKWYDKVVADDDSYQNKVILPNILRQLDIKKGDKILDLACGQGFFSEHFSLLGAQVIACDISPELIEIARKKAKGKVEYKICSADNLAFLTDKSLDKIVILLALQNIENVSAVFKECRRVLKRGGELHLVLNHPAYRIPQASEWGWDEKKMVQYRRVDKYLSEDKIKIQTHPGSNPDEFTISFHRPLQYFFKLLGKNMLAVTGMEEWISHTKTPSGPRADAENSARKEIPLFMYLKTVAL